MGVARATVPHISASTEIEAAAAEVRAILVGDTSLTRKPTTPAKEQGQWRARLEALGVFVLMLPLGRESIRGFSLYDDFAPIVAINTHWDYQPRVFTMLHEFNHLVSRTSSACVETLQHRLPDSEDRVERWCEQVAAAVLMPWTGVSNFLSRDLQLSSEKHVTSLDQLFRVAKYFGTSARAAALRLIGRKRAGWELYRQIPAIAEQKHGGRGGGGRNRQEIREDEYGARMIRTFAQAVQEGLITATDATGFLRISELELESWHA
jgi:Zn-dependent peptidase ImmA (M78 family)